MDIRKNNRKSLINPKSSRKWWTKIKEYIKQKESKQHGRLKYKHINNHIKYE